MTTTPKPNPSRPAAPPPKDPGALEVFRDAWKSTLGALGSAEEETQALLGRMVQLGRLTREEGTRLYGEVKEMVEVQRNELEVSIQRSIDNALRALTIPTQQELSEVAQKLAELERRVEALDDAMPREDPPPRPSRTRTKAKPAEKKTEPDDEE